jgi:hypothetical protein
VTVRKMQWHQCTFHMLGPVQTAGRESFLIAIRRAFTAGGVASLAWGRNLPPVHPRLCAGRGIETGISGRESLRPVISQYDTAPCSNRYGGEHWRGKRHVRIDARLR